MNTSTQNILLVGVIAFGLFWYYDNYIQNDTPANPDNPSPTPTPTQLGNLPAVFAAADESKVFRLGLLFEAMADTLERNPAPSSSQLREYLVSADSYFIRGTDIAGAVPGFGAAKDALIEQRLGLEDRALTDADKAQVVTLFREIAKLAGVK